jgi:hypothetical protein
MDRQLLWLVVIFGVGILLMVFSVIFGYMKSNEQHRRLILRTFTALMFIPFGVTVLCGGIGQLISWLTGQQNQVLVAGAFSFGTIASFVVEVAVYRNKDRLLMLIGLISTLILCLGMLIPLAQAIGVMYFPKS